MTATAPWSVKGIDPHAREVAKDLARREGMTLGEWLNRMIVEQGGEPADMPQTAADPVPLEPSVRGLLGRVERSEREQTAVAARFEQLADELRTDQMRLAERLRRMEQDADNGGSGGVTEALHALEQTVGRLAGHVYDGEGRTNDVIRDLGACFVKLDGRLRQVEGRGAVTGDVSFVEALEGVRGEIVALSSDLERKLSRVDAINAHSLEKLGAEVARISERLAERITNAERRASLSAEEVGEQVSRVAERIHQRQERAAEDVNERFRQAEDRTAKMLEGMRADIEASFAAAKARPAGAPAPGPGPLGPMETALPESPVFAAPKGELMSTREVIDQARANVQPDGEAGPINKNAPFAPLLPPRRHAKRRSSSATLQTALFVTGTAAALGAGVASYMLGVAEPSSPTISVKSADADRANPAADPARAEPRMAVALGPQTVSKTAPAAALTGPAAQYGEAVRLLQAKDPKGVAELKEAAEAGLPAAQFHLARLYESGEGVRKNETEARRWTEQAARGGDAKAMHNLALYYFEGVGGTKDTPAAAVWFRRAAEKGVTDSQYNLGRLYEEGYGVAKDPKAALRWYDAAARSGDAEAKAAAARMKTQLGTDTQ